MTQAKETTATTFGDRLRLAMKHAGLNQSELVSLTGIAQSTVATALRGAIGSMDTAVYAKVCGVDALWLTTGKGLMANASGPVQGIPCTLFTFGERLREVRERLGITGNGLANITGVTQSTISKLEVGTIAYPSCENLFPLADALKVSARWLVTGHEAHERMDDPVPIELSENLERLVSHLQTLDDSKVDGLLALLGIKQS